MMLWRGTPVSSSTRSRSYSLTFSFSSSMPSVRSAINSLFSQPFAKMTLMMPFNRAILLPGARLSQTSARLAIQVLRGSATTSLAPFARASFRYRETMGCPSVGFEPKRKRVSISGIWSSEFVAAPAPRLVARPATVGACQTRAQLSTLLEPTAQRTHLARR